MVEGATNNPVNEGAEADKDQRKAKVRYVDLRDEDFFDIKRIFSTGFKETEETLAQPLPGENSTDRKELLEGAELVVSRIGEQNVQSILNTAHRHYRREHGRINKIAKSQNFMDPKEIQLSIADIMKNQWLKDEIRENKDFGRYAEYIIKNICFHHGFVSFKDGMDRLEKSVETYYGSKLLWDNVSISEIPLDSLDSLGGFVEHRNIPTKRRGA